MCGVPYHSVRGLHRPAHRQGLQGGHLRADGGPRHRPRAWWTGTSSASSPPAPSSSPPCWRRGETTSSPPSAWTRDAAGVCFCDISTGEVSATAFAGPDWEEHLYQRAGPLRPPGGRSSTPPPGTGAPGPTSSAPGWTAAGRTGSEADFAPDRARALCAEAVPLGAGPCPAGGRGRPPGRRAACSPTSTTPRRPTCPTSPPSDYYSTGASSWSWT